MSPQLICLSLEASIQAYMNNTILPALFAAGVTAELFDLDAHAIDSSVPDVHLLTYSNFTMVEDEKEITMDAALGASTVRDSDLKTLRLMTAILFDHLRTGCSFPAIDYFTGEKLGMIIVKNGTRITPISGEDNRPVRAAIVTFGTTLT